MSKNSSQHLAVTSKIKETTFIDPFKAYTALCKEHDEKELFLLESLAGPAKDKKSALIGIHPIFTLELWRDHVKLSGIEPLVEYVQTAVKNSGKFKFTNNEIFLTEKADLWNLLRFIESQFHLSADLPANTFSFGFFGYLGYDTVWYMEDLPYHIQQREDMPDLYLSIYQYLIQFDLEKHQAQLIEHTAEGFWKNTINLSELVEKICSNNSLSTEMNIEVPKPSLISGSTLKQKYLQDVQKALHYISIGDIYQVQLGHEVIINTGAKPLDVYYRLRSRNPSPYMYYASFGNIKLIGASPELFLRIENGEMNLRPIAGTIKRGKNDAEDERAIAQLLHDEKEVAEHVMLVDLCRNDVGRVCVPNTMEVNEIMIVEKYSHVFHMVSNVIGQVSPQFDSFDVISATFPEGTMTGAPKIRAMEIIEELETKRRGAYAGAIGLIGFNGYVNLALCIRTAFYTNNQYMVRASAGIVADSIPENEWNETLSKMGAVYWAITGEELSHEYIGD